MPSDLQWIVGPTRAAVRRRESRTFNLWPKPTERDRVPMGLHMALARPDDELYSDPSATRSLVALGLPVPRIPTSVATGLTAVAFALAAAGPKLGGGRLVGLPDHSIANGPDLAAVLFAAVLGYSFASAWEAGIAAAKLDPGARCFGFGAKGPSVEPVVWRLGLPAASAVLALIGPIAWSLAVLAWGEAQPAAASGFAMGASLYVLRIALPIRPGPVTRLLGVLLRVPDFSGALRWALTTQFLPASQRPTGRRPGLLVVGIVVLFAWIVVAGIALPVLVSPDGFRAVVAAQVGDSSAGQGDRSPSAGMRDDTAGDLAAQGGRDALTALPLRIWRVVMSIVGIAVLLWLIESIARLFRYALLFGGRVEREPVSPNPAARSFWARENALCRHVPALARMPWQWSRAGSGTLLVRQGDLDRSFHWLASGEARVVMRDDAGNLRQLATLRGGSGVGEMALLEDRPRTADVVVSRTALVVSLSYDDFERGMSADDRDRFGEVVLAGRAFAASSVFRGCPPSDKERWIRAGTPRRYSVGDTIISEGGTDRWMGLVVDGRITVQQRGAEVAELESASVVGEAAFLYEQTRNASLVAKTDVLLWSWDPEWLADEVIRAGVKADLEALVAERAAPQSD